MALSATSIAEVQTGGSDTANGGLFDPGQTAGMFTDGAATVANTAAPVFTSASYNFIAGDVGAWVYIASGTNWLPGWYKIASVAANAATLNATIAQAALSASSLFNGSSTVVGCASVASPTTATWTIDYSQQAAAQFTYTDLASAGTGLTVSSAAKPFAKQQVGNSIVITGGTNFNTGRYVIASVAAAVATVVGPTNITTGAGASGTGGQGGSFASTGAAGAVMVAGNDMFVASGTYTITSASSNVAAGCLTLPAGSAASNTTKMVGYLTYRGDRGTKPILRSDGTITTFTLITTGTNNRVENIEADGNSRTSSRGFSFAATSATAVRCRARNCTNSGFAASNSVNSCLLCEATGCSTLGAFLSVSCTMCVAYSNTVHGFIQNSVNAVNFNDCVSVNNSGTSDGFNIGTGAGQIVNCTAYNNGRYGFYFNTGSARLEMINCLSVSNSSYGFSGATSPSDNAYLYNCAGYNNGTALVNASIFPAAQQIGLITLTADPFTNAGSSDFSLNNTSGGGAAVRGAGIPALSAGLYGFPGLSTNDYPDVGGVQHADPVVVVSQSLIARNIGTY